MFDDPFPVGDPAGMRALAARLQGAAAELDGRTDRAVEAVRSLSFEGPKAARFRDHVATNQAKVRSLSNEMNELASILLAGAARVDQAITAWHARRAVFLAREQSR